MSIKYFTFCESCIYVEFDMVYYSKFTKCEKRFVMSNNILGNRIATLRQKNKLSQVEFSQLLNISNTTLSQYESGKRIPSDNIKIKIADYFNVSLDYLFGRTNVMDTVESILNNTSNSIQLNNINLDSNIPPQVEEEIIKFKEYLMHKYRKEENKKYKK